jgi:N-acetylglucosamine malate deacetylase 1
MTRVLALHAHPDDIEILCSGTLALLAARGHAVVIATLTAGEGGALDMSPEETARVRRGEASASAAVIGADYLCAGLSDLGVFNDDRGRRAATEVIRAARAEIVLAPAPEDYHPDHEAGSILARDACFAASVPNYATGSPPLAAIPHLYFVDPIGARDRNGRRAAADFAVDVTSVMAVKAEMLDKHESQGRWVERQHDIPDPTADMRAFSARRGQDFGFAYAEAFRQYTGHPYPRSPLLQSLVEGVSAPALPR